MLACDSRHSEELKVFFIANKFGGNLSQMVVWCLEYINTTKLPGSEIVIGVTEGVKERHCFFFLLEIPKEGL